MQQKIIINSQFDSGNIKIVAADSAADIQLEINKDSHSDYYQWFHFELQSSPGIAHTMRLMNASGAAYAEGWDGYQAVASYDGNTWFRVNTEYTDGELIICHTPESASIHYAYFAPFSYQRHLDLLHQVQQSPLCRIEHLGKTVENKEMTAAVINRADNSTGNSKKNIWIIARQHPGETMAEWFCEGLLKRLLDENDTVARKLLQYCTFYVVPNMNPDGAVLGNLRCNARGSNLNREWLEPSLEKSPEVYQVREKMLQTGVDLFLDIHGDEAIPYNFLAGCEGIPSFDATSKARQDCFKAAFLEASPEFQTVEGYPDDQPGKANLTMASTWVGEQFHCLSYTLEMPFKDNNNLPDPVSGWSAARSAELGASILQPILTTITKF